MFLLGAVVVALASAPGAAKQGPKSSDWRPAKTSALALAQTVDQRLNSLSSTSFHGFFEYDGPIGKGYIGPEAEIKNQKVFRILFPMVGATEDEGLRWGVWISNGQNVLTQTERLKNRWDRDPVKAPYPGNRRLPKPLLGTWFDSFGREMLSAIGTHNKPLTELVMEASKPGTGLFVTCQQRDVKLGKNMIPYDRIMISRTPAQEKKLGAKLYEIIIQPNFKLPTSFFNEYSKGKRLYKSDLTRIDWNTSPHQVFPQKDFSMSQAAF